MTPPRNQVATIARLLRVGALTPAMLGEIDVAHETGCPGAAHESLDCTCAPTVSYHGKALWPSSIGARSMYEIGMKY